MIAWAGRDDTRVHLGRDLSKYRCIHRGPVTIEHYQEAPSAREGTDSRLLLAWVRAQRQRQGVPHARR